MKTFDLLALIARWKTPCFLLCVTALLVTLVGRRFRKGLRDIPGPFLASILSWDRISSAASGHQYQTHIDYHRRYGPEVRVGPNHVSFSNADTITQIYGITSKFVKSRFYTMFDVRSPVGDLHTVFSIRDEAAHRALKRPVANAYSMSTLVELEPMTDDCITLLEQKLDSKQGQNINLGEWVHWYAFDVITSISFSNRMGFMDQEKDVSGIIEAIEGRLVYNSVIGEVPFLHKYLLGNTFVAAVAKKIPAVERLNSARYIAAFAAKQLDRYKTDKPTDQLRDMLARFKRSRDGEEVMSDKDLLSHATSNIFAGADTTAISLRAMFYYLCKNPRCYAKLVQEIDALESSNGLSRPVITFAESQKMPYLQVCMKEAMRLHPAVGMLLERLVPEGGATVGNSWLPEGTIVGVNPWVMSRDKSVYGEDVDKYRPERWLEANANTLRLMERNFLAFGSGSRTCLGKNVSLLEMSKLVPQLLRDFTVELVDPMAEWKLSDHWFVKQTNLHCRITRRSQSIV